MRLLFSSLLLFCLLNTYHTQAQLSLDMETGVVFDGYNNIRVPGNEGTLISFSDDLTTLTRAFYRLRLSYLFSEKHFLSVLYAPLTLRAEGTFDDQLFFRQTTFDAGILLDASYQFNSYRLTYRYMFPRSGTFQWGIGATAKIRDARIAIAGSGQQAEKTNLGFVPLINFLAEWRVKERLSLLFTGDALIAPQGRAEDVLLAALLYPSENLTLKLGYRVLEGGADNEEVYNFTLLHYAVIGGILTF